MAIDPDIKAMFNGTLHVRRPTLVAGSTSETVGAAVDLSAFIEPRTEYRPGSSPERVTVHFVIVDDADVAASSLVTLRDSDRYWINSEPTTGPGKKARVEGPFTDPESPSTKTHWEVTL